MRQIFTLRRSRSSSSSRDECSSTGITLSRDLVPSSKRDSKISSNFRVGLELPLFEDSPNGTVGCDGVMMMRPSTPPIRLPDHSLIVERINKAVEIRT